MPIREKELEFFLFGNKGFLGSQTSKKLVSERVKVRALEGKITSASDLDFFTKSTLKDTIFLNFAGTGVTPKWDQDDGLSLINKEILEKLLPTFISSDARNFIHFASNYEKSELDSIPISRQPYVKSKIATSDICKRFIRLDSRIKLLYLPTIISSAQPHGRFFRDFVECSRQGIGFNLLNPGARVSITTFDYFYDHLMEFVDSQHSISEVEPEFESTVLDFAVILNKILVELGCSEVKMHSSHSFMGSFQDLESLKLRPSFERTLRSYMEEILGGHNG